MCAFATSAMWRRPKRWRPCGKIAEASLPLVLDSGFLQAFIGKGAASLFSGTGTTQRPDTLCAKLAEGAEWALWWTAAPM